ncbi:hypothetical protein ACYDMD_06200 [Pantoea agglomerans]
MKIEWIKVDGMMVAIDKTTGEILDESLTPLPADYDVSKAVIDVLEDMFGGSVKPTSEIKQEKRGRKAKELSNPYASFFANVQYSEETGGSNISGVVDDLVYSACTASSGNTRLPVKQLLHVMRCADLSVKGIQNYLSKRRIIKGEASVGERYSRSILASADALIKGIQRHEELGTINLNDSSAFRFDADSVAYERSQGVVNAMLCPVEFTEGDKRTIRALARAGNIEAINDYLQRVTEQSGRMMQRILGKPLSEDSKQAYDQLDAEFPYEPYEDDNGYVMRRKRLTSPIIKEPCSVSWMFKVERQME